MTFAASAQDWGQVTTPAPGPTQSIGFYTAGCLQGAQALPLDGPGYEAIRISRNRYWGQPVTLDFIKRFSEQVRAAGQAPLYIGDIGQPRGGPAPSGHASHQIGLDVDIWFERQPGARRARPTARTRACARWCAPPTTASTTPCSPTSTWRCCGWPRTSPGVDRIFANKWIKQRLCQTVDRQPLLAEQDRGLGGPRRAFPCPHVLPARQSAVPGAGRLLRRRRAAASSSMSGSPSRRCACRRPARRCRPTGRSCRRPARRC